MSKRSFDIIKGNIEHLSDTMDLSVKSVVLFGVNSSSFKMVNYLKEKGIVPKAIIDNNLNFSNKTYLGIKAGTPEAMIGDYDKNIIILIASRYFNEMKQQLLDMGYLEDQIYQMIKYQVYDTELSSIEENINESKKGLEVYKKLRKEFGVDKKIIMCPYAGLGDIYFISRYINQYCEIHYIDNFVLTVIGNTSKKISQMFGIENIKVLTQIESDMLLHFAAFIGAKKLNVEILTHTLVPFEKIMYNFEQSERLDWGTIFRRVVLEVSEDITLQYNVVEKEADNNILLEKIKNIFCSCKTAIISPYTNTLANIEDEFWEKIVMKLKENGYQVFTNSIGEQEPAIIGSLPITFPIEIAKEVIECADIFIGVRSGFCDVIEAAQGNIFILYPDKHSLFYNLKGMGFGENATECLYNEIWEKQNWTVLMQS